MTRYRIAVHLEAFHGEAVIAIGSEHEILDRMFGAALRGKTDQRLGECDLFGKPLTHRIEDTVAQAGFDAHEGTRRKVKERPPRQYKACRGESNALSAEDIPGRVDPCALLLENRTECGIEDALARRRACILVRLHIGQALSCPLGLFHHKPLALVPLGTIMS